jgi:hypothetical protein
MSPVLRRYSSDTEFDDLMSNVDAGDMCENLELLHLDENEEAEEDENDKTDGSMKHKLSSVKVEKSRGHKQHSSNWSFSLGSFDDSYSEDVTAAMEELSIGTSVRDDTDAVNLSGDFLLNLPKRTNSNSSHLNTITSSIHSKYQSSLHDVESEAEEEGDDEQKLQN